MPGRYGKEWGRSCSLSIFAASPSRAGRGPKTVPQLISTYPSDRTNHYLKHHYERSDPVIARTLERPQPFKRGSGFGRPLRNESEFELFDEAARFGIRREYAPIHDGNGGVAAVTFATNERKPRFEQADGEHAEVLQLIRSIFTHTPCRKLLVNESKARHIKFAGLCGRSV